MDKLKSVHIIASVSTTIFQNGIADCKIVSNERIDEGKLRFAADHDETIFLPIKNILRLGMQEGVFRKFSETPLRGMALTIRHAIDGFSLELMRNPDLNVKDYTKELITIFERTTQK